MKYCNICHVYINNQLKRCPLCGSHTEEKETNYTQYKNEIEPKVCYPKIQLKGDAYHNFLRKKSWFIVLTVMIVCVLINLLETPTKIWSGYIVVSGLVVYFGILRPIFSKNRFYYMLSLLGFLVPASAILFDIVNSINIIGDTSLFGTSIDYIAPAVLAALIITTDILSFTDKSKYKYYITSLIILTVLSAAPQIVVWASPAGKYNTWFPFSVCAFALLNFAIIAIIYWKKVVAEMKRKFFI
ncbi:MAG: DUF6320 domain-containing protein [Clostridia bacterium]